MHPSPINILQHSQRFSTNWTSLSTCVFHPFRGQADGGIQCLTSETASRCRSQWNLWKSMWKNMWKTYTKTSWIKYPTHSMGQNGSAVVSSDADIEVDCFWWMFKKVAKSSCANPEKIWTSQFEMFDFWYFLTIPQTCPHQKCHMPWSKHRNMVIRSIMGLL